MTQLLKIPREVLVELEAHLNDEKSRVTAHIADLQMQDPFADTDRLMDNAASDTEASEEVNHERYQAMLAELKVKLEAVGSALARIKSGTYGYCKMCGEMIDTDRLAAMPTALLCMSCEAKKKR